MIKGALALQVDSLVKALTAGIFRPSLGRLRPSTKTTGRLPIRTIRRENSPERSGARPRRAPPPAGRMNGRNGASRVTAIAQTEAAHQTGDAGQIGPETKGGQHHGQPEEGDGSVAARTEGLNGSPPSGPKHQRAAGGEGG
jgi:hypothetical protein